jgi:hypothetical protein
MGVLISELLIMALVVLFVVGVRHIQAQEPQKDPLAQCQIEVERLRAYSSILKGDRDQKEAALAEYGVQLRTLQAEIARLKEPKKETK